MNLKSFAWAAVALAAELLAIAARVRSHLIEPLPSSDHSWLYGEDGLPAGRGDFALTDIEPALKDFETYSSALDAAGIRYTRGALLTVKYALATGAEKRLAAEHTGAVAVDMETAVIAFEAAARGIPFVAMRTIIKRMPCN